MLSGAGVDPKNFGGPVVSLRLPDMDEVNMLSRLELGRGFDLSGGGH